MMKNLSSKSGITDTDCNRNGGAQYVIRFTMGLFIRSFRSMGSTGT